MKNRKSQSAHRDLVKHRERIIIFSLTGYCKVCALDGCIVCLGEHFPSRSQLDVSWCMQECQSTNRTVTEHGGEALDLLPESVDSSSSSSSGGGGGGVSFFTPLSVAVLACSHRQTALLLWTPCRVK